MQEMSPEGRVIYDATRIIDAEYHRVQRHQHDTRIFRLIGVTGLGLLGLGVELAGSTSEVSVPMVALGSLALVYSSIANVWEKLRFRSD